MQEHVSVRIADIVIIVLYFLGMIGVGVWTTRKIKQTEDFFVGGRAMPGWAVGLSLLGTAISSVTFLAYPGSAFEGNWSRLMQGLMLPIAALVGVTFFIVFYRRSLFVSAYQYFEKRFGSWGRTYASIAYIIYQIFRMGAVLFLLSLPVHVLTGWSLMTIIILVGIIVTLYTFLGGLEAVIWTDVVQTILLVLGGLVVIPLVFIKTPGSIGELIGMAAANGKFDLTTSWQFDLTRDTFWVFALSGIIGNIQEFSTDQIKIQRYAAPTTDGQAKGAAWIVGLGCIPVWSLFMFIGTCLWIFYNYSSATLPNGGIRPDEVFPYFIIQQVPVGIAGLIIAAVMAATMSTISSSLNAATTVITVDWYKALVVKGRSDKHYLIIARVVNVLLGVLMIYAAFELSTMDMRTFLDIGFFLGAVFSAGLGGLFLLGFFFKRANSRGAMIGVAAGVLMILWLTFSNLTGFTMTDNTFAALRAEGVSETLIEKIEPLKDKSIGGYGKFTNALEDSLKKDLTKPLKKLILNNTKAKGIIPVSINAPIHPFVINVFGNMTVLIVGLFASLFWAAPTREQLKKATWWTKEDE